MISLTIFVLAKETQNTFDVNLIVEGFVIKLKVLIQFAEYYQLC